MVNAGVIYCLNFSELLNIQFSLQPVSSSTSQRPTMQGIPLTSNQPVGKFYETMIQSWWESTSDAKFVKSVPNLLQSTQSALTSAEVVVIDAPVESVFFSLTLIQAISWDVESMWVATMSCQGIIKKDTYCVVVKVPLPLKEGQEGRADTHGLRSGYAWIGCNLRISHFWDFHFYFDAIVPKQFLVESMALGWWNPLHQLRLRPGSQVVQIHQAALWSCPSILQSLSFAA